MNGNIINNFSAFKNATTIAVYITFCPKSCTPIYRRPKRASYNEPALPIAVQESWAIRMIENISLTKERVQTNICLKSI
jgi:hypothetical protein